MMVSLLADSSYAAGRVLGALVLVVGIPYALWRIAARFRVRRGLRIVLVAIVGLLLVEAAALGNRSPSTSSGSIGAAPASAATVGVAASSGGNPFVGLPTVPAIIYFVPLDAHAKSLIHSVAPAVQKYLPYAVQVKTIPSVPSRWIDKTRSGEWNGRTVANDLLADYKSVRGNTPVFILAVTSTAIYDPGTPYFAFVFGVLWWHKPPQFAAVYGTQPMRAYQPEREKARLTKMMLRYTGLVVCNQQHNNDRHSVLYSTILGTPDLDRMVATLPAACRIR
jgi:hypothetical protein